MTPKPKTRNGGPSQRALWGWKVNTGKPSWKRDPRPFVCYQTWVGFFVFLDITAFFFQPLFVPIPLIRKGVFFCLHSSPPVSVKMCLFYFHSINSGSNVDRMFLDFWKRSVRPEGSLKFDCVILHVLPNRSTVLRRSGSLPTTSFLVRDYE